MKNQTKNGKNTDSTATLTNDQPRFETSLVGQSGGDAGSTVDLARPIVIETLVPAGGVTETGKPDAVNATPIVAAAGSVAKTTKLDFYIDVWADHVARAESMGLTENIMHNSFKRFCEVCFGSTEADKAEKTYRQSRWEQFKADLLAAKPLTITYQGKSLSVIKIGDGKAVYDRKSGLSIGVKRTVQVMDHHSKLESVNFHADQYRRAKAIAGLSD